MEIFFVSRGWPSAREPQWGSFERDQALALATLGHQIVVLSVDVRAKFIFRKYGISKQKENGITIYSLYAGPLWGRFLKFFSWKASRRIKREFFLYLLKETINKEGVPDILYAHYFGNSEMAVAAKQRYKIPIIGIEHFSALGKEKISGFMRQRADGTYNHLDVLLTVSSSLRENILKQLGVNSIVVNNMVGPEFQYLPQIRANEKVRFVTTGNLLPVKGYDVLVKAFKHANLPANSWSLDIIGGGPEFKKLYALIESLGLADYIRLLGRKERQFVIEELHNSDVYILSSRLETFGVAAIEALACGLPIVATECGGPLEFVNKNNGITCLAGSVEQLASSIQYMFEHYRDYDRQQIAEECNRLFSSEAIGRQLEEIFIDVINKNTPK